MKPTLILDCYLDGSDGTFNYRRIWADRPVVRIRPPLDPLPTDLSTIGGIVITGSKASVVDSAPWIPDLFRLLRQAAAEQLPTLGVCFGHQALGAAFGGPRGVGLAPTPEVGLVDITITKPDPLLEGLDPTFSCFVSHRDEVRGPSGDLVGLAHSAGCGVQALRLPGAPVWGVQFHPEMQLEEIERLLIYRADLHPELQIDIGAELKRVADHTFIGPQIFRNFFQILDTSP